MTPVYRMAGRGAVGPRQKAVWLYEAGYVTLSAASLQNLGRGGKRKAVLWAEFEREAE